MAPKMFCSFLLGSVFVFMFAIAAPCMATPPDTVSPKCAQVDADARLHAPHAVEDRRVQLLSGAWTVASVSLENEWHLFDKNPGRKACSLAIQELPDTHCELTQSHCTPYNFYTTSAGVAQW